MAGQVAIVTGSASGIGRASALAFARAGARVVINYSRSEGEAQETADLVRSAGSEALVIQADVGKVAAVNALVQQTIDTWGRVDVLVNSAGTTVFKPYADLEDLDALTEADWDRVLAVNVKGVYFASKAVAAPMKAQGQGTIINIASVAGIKPVGSSIPYCASKAAVLSLTQTMALALAPEIRVNAVAPGFIATRWWAGRDDVAQTVEASTPLQRNGTAEDIAEMVYFLATSALFSTGETLVADGGRTLR
ncbi:MAG: 3-ketoacyl-ACP reductase [Dehalococcoidia bacterium]|nr:3-ketoacyl-ACP reductase [Dehalococcoidia bacterium]